MWRDTSLINPAAAPGSPCPARERPDGRVGKRRRRISRRARRRLVFSLRLAATLDVSARGAGRWRVLMLLDRVEAVRSDLLELATVLEQADDPDPAAVSAVRALLKNRCDSPLYDARVHPSELKATLYYAKRRLMSRRDGRASAPLI